LLLSSIQGRRGRLVGPTDTGYMLLKKSVAGKLATSVEKFSFSSLMRDASSISQVHLRDGASTATPIGRDNPKTRIGQLRLPGQSLYLFTEATAPLRVESAAFNTRNSRRQGNRRSRSTSASKFHFQPHAAPPHPSSTAAFMSDRLICGHQLSERRFKHGLLPRTPPVSVKSRNNALLTTPASLAHEKFQSEEGKGRQKETANHSMAVGMRTFPLFPTENQYFPADRCIV